MANRWETMQTVTGLFSWAPKSLQMVTAAMKKKRHLVLGRKARTNLDSLLKSRDFLDCMIKPISPKGNQSCIFIRRTDAEAETPILRPPDAKN